jgi:hypothetical protein
VVGNDDSVFVIKFRGGAGDDGRRAEAVVQQSAISDLKTIVDEQESLVGRRVTLSGVQVDKAGENGGFVAMLGGEDVFVLMPDGQRVRAGGTVWIEGIVLRPPASMGSRLDSRGDLSTDEVYMYAPRVS